jgi:dTMP kinase
MTDRRRGIFLTFEGGDGSGKSTQLRMLGEKLRAEGHAVVETAEPGGTAIGAKIRRILLDASNQELCPTAELLLMFASRAQNVDQLILPALGEGKIVLCDRFTDSSLVYQGAARGLGSETVLDVDRVACRGLVPDLTIYVDVEVEVGLARTRKRNEALRGVETRLDEQALDFHKKARDAYLKLVADEPQRVKMVDGGRDPECVAADVWQITDAFIESRRQATR